MLNYPEEESKQYPDDDGIPMRMWSSNNYSDHSLSSSLSSSLEVGKAPELLEHDLQSGDHVIRWSHVALYPIQIHGIVLETSPIHVILVDFGYTDKKASTENTSSKWEPPPDSKRFHIRTLTTQQEVDKWKKVGYGGTNGTSSLLSTTSNLVSWAKKNMPQISYKVNYNIISSKPKSNSNDDKQEEDLITFTTNDENQDKLSSFIELQDLSNSTTSQPTQSHTKNTNHHTHPTNTNNHHGIGNHHSTTNQEIELISPNQTKALREQQYHHPINNDEQPTSLLETNAYLARKSVSRVWSSDANQIRELRQPHYPSLSSSSSSSEQEINPPLSTTSTILQQSFQTNAEVARIARQSVSRAWSSASSWIQKSKTVASQQLFPQKKKQQQQQQEEEKQQQEEVKLPKSDPNTLVLARVSFLLASAQKDFQKMSHEELILPPYHAFLSNSECMAVWCKTGQWSTLQASIFLYSTAVGHGKQVTLGLGAVAAMNPFLVPAVAGLGAMYVGAPYLYLNKCKSQWEKITHEMNDKFWAQAEPQVFIDCIHSWSQLKSEYK